MKKYYPILISKKGEIVALQRLEQNVKDEICPILEIVENTIIKNQKNGGFEYKDDLEKFFKTHWSFFGNQIIIDFSLFDRWDIHRDKIRNLLIYLTTSGVNIIPAIQKGSSKIYKDIVKELIDEYSSKVCLRTSIAIDGFFEFNNDIENFRKEFRVKPNQTILLLDLGDIYNVNFQNYSNKTAFTIDSLKYPLKDWADVVVVSSSFPENLTNFSVSPPEGRIKRYEWESWKIINSENRLNAIKYGDYGTKAALYADVGFAGTVSLKYAAKEDYLIFRGELTEKHKLGHGQFIQHTKDLVKNINYSGKDFSWGDLRYYEISTQYLDGKPGNSTNWVQYGQNHHLTLMHSIL